MTEIDVNKVIAYQKRVIACNQKIDNLTAKKEVYLSQVQDILKELNFSTVEELEEHYLKLLKELEKEMSVIDLELTRAEEVLGGIDG